MSSRNLRRRQDSWGSTYRLNRAALMRMEAGRRKINVKDDSALSRLLSIEFDKPHSARRSTNMDRTESYSEHAESSAASASENEMDVKDDESITNRPQRRTRKSRMKRKGRRNSSTITYQSRQYYREKSRSELYQPRKLTPERQRRKARSPGRRKDLSEGSVVEKLSAYTQIPPKRKARTKSQSSQVPTVVYKTSRSRERGYRDRPRLNSPRRNADTMTSRSPRRNADTMTSRSPSPMYEKSLKRLSSQETVPMRQAAVSWAPLVSSVSIAEDPEPPGAPDRAKDHGSGINVRQNSPPNITSHLGTYVPVNEAKQDLKESALTSSSTLKGETARNEKLYAQLKAAAAPNLLASSRKEATESKPGIINKRFSFKPTIPDQYEVISKWRRRVGTTSPSTTSHDINSSALASSTLRDSQILRVHSVQPSNKPKKKDKTASKSPESGFPERSLDELELQALITELSREQPLKSEGAVVFELDREKIKTKIRRLEEVVRAKLEMLEAIRWKKRKALEEEKMLNEKLKGILIKIQNLRESGSFAELIDKQTQVFATKKPKTVT